MMHNSHAGGTFSGRPAAAGGGVGNMITGKIRGAQETSNALLNELETVQGMKPIVQKIRVLNPKVVSGCILLSCLGLFFTGPSGGGSGVTTFDEDAHHVVLRVKKDFGPVMHRRKEKELHHINNQHLYNIHNVLLSDEEDEDLKVEKESGETYHLVFSSDCTPFHHWQSYLVYYSALKVKQPGHITRIVSGCDEHDAVEMMDWFEYNVQPLSNRFHIYLTPDYTQIKNSDTGVMEECKFMNKPHGMKYWMEQSHELDFKAHGTFDGAPTEHDIIIVIDPDMILIRPILNDFSNPKFSMIAKERRDNMITPSDKKFKVSKGFPFAQLAGHGEKNWHEFDLAKITGDPNTKAKNVDEHDSRMYFVPGEPMMATTGDMYNLVTKWTEFAGRTFDEFPKGWAEQVAFRIAAAHLELRFTLVNSLIISDPEAWTHEAWNFIDVIKASDVCHFAKNINQDIHPTTNAIHMISRYSVGTEWYFGKGIIPHNVYDCDHPLFLEPPNSVAVFYNYRWPPASKDKTIVEAVQIRRESFVICALTSLMNEAATMHKSTSCISDKHGENMKGDKNINLKEEMKIADLFGQHTRAVQMSSIRAWERKNNPLHMRANDTMPEPERAKRTDGQVVTSGNN